MRKAPALRLLSCFSLFLCLSLAESPNTASPKTPSNPTQDKAPQAKSQIFLGIGSGSILSAHSPATGSALDSSALDSAPLESSHLSLSVSARGGYQYRFAPFLQGRVFLDYSLSLRPSGLESITTSLFLINTDALLSLPAPWGLRFGGFVGIGLGYGSYGKEVYDDVSALDSVLGRGFSARGNVGLFLSYAQGHRLEASIKLPLNALPLPPLSPSHPASTYKETHFLLVYDYVF